MANVSQFVREVKQEAGKVVWPTRKETTISTIMVFIMVLILGIFFLVVDQILAWGVSSILSIGG